MLFRQKLRSTRSDTNNSTRMKIFQIKRRYTLNTSAKTIIFIATLLLGLNAAHASGDPEAGKLKAVTCGACHGADGNSSVPTWPSIAGQNEAYLVETLKAFRAGMRPDAGMTAQAMLLAEEDIADVAAYFAAQKPVYRTADPKFVDLGERLYRGGDIDNNISACVACHGPGGRGNPAAGYPALAGQHAMYTAKQLNDYKSQARTSDGDTQIMRNITARLTQEEIEALSAYIQGLR